MILTMTFARSAITGRTNILSKFEGPIPKHCQVIKPFSTKGPGDLDLCPQDHLLVRTNIYNSYNLNNFGRGPLDEATYQISKTWAFLVSDKQIF